MPTIELISIDCLAIPDLPCYPSFTYQTETRLVSHCALFQSVFDTLSGVIVHLANKDMEGEEGCWFAGQLMDWTSMGDELAKSCETVLVFRTEARDDVKDLMQRLLAASPQHRITFSTDYQFGGERRECGEVTLTQFFAFHDRRLFRYNSLFIIRADDR